MDALPLALALLGISALGVVLALWARSRDASDVVVRDIEIGPSESSNPSIKFRIVNEGTSVCSVVSSRVSLRVLRPMFWSVRVRREIEGGVRFGREIAPGSELGEALNLQPFARLHAAVGRLVLLRARVRLDNGKVARSRLHICRMPHARRIEVLTIVFTDIEDSLAQSDAAGDEVWRSRLAEHEALVRTRLGQCDGHVVKSTGDGFLLAFRLPSEAVRCVLGIIATSTIGVRAGCHAGQVEVLQDGDVIGVAVSLAERVQGCAEAGHLLATEAVRQLLRGDREIDFTDMGNREFKGVLEPWHLYAVHLSREAS